MADLWEDRAELERKELEDPLLAHDTTQNVIWPFYGA